MTSQTGEQYRVVFLVELIGGEAKARVISAEIITELAPAGKGGSQKRSQSEPLYLPSITASTITDTVYIFDFTPVVSPFTSLLFYTSQPTRAPSF